MGATQAEDLAYFERWHQDLKAQQEELYRIALLEVEARLRRMAWTYARLEHPGYSAGTSGTHLQQARQMALFIARHYSETLSVEQIARVVNLHPNYAMKLFRDQFHTSILDYLARHRVAHAQRLLLTTDKQIMQIGLESGFGSSSRFYAVFKRCCGQSPGRYRRQLQPPRP